MLLDLAMPEMDGWTLAATLSAAPEYRDVPLIAVTGHLTKDEIQRALDAGCRDYLPKPIEYEELIAKVRVYIG
jgi:CheY-like chemotaxis protein